MDEMRFKRTPRTIDEAVAAHHAKIVEAVEAIPTHHDSLAGMGERTALAFASELILALAKLQPESR